MKRIKQIALVLAMLLTLTACNSVNVTEVAKIGDSAMYKSEFMYYLQSGKGEASQKAQAAGQTLENDKDWKTVMIDGVTAAQYAKDRAEKSVKTMLVAEAKGREAGYVMTEADLQEVASQKEQIIQQLGGRYSYEQALSEIGIETAALDGIIGRSVYANAYLASISGEADFMNPSEEEIQKKYEDEYVFVRHILISNQTPSAAELEEAMLSEEQDAPMSTLTDPVEYDNMARKEAEEILAKLEEGADFVALMNEHSDDSRDENGALMSDGYVMTDNGQMVPEFEKAAMALSEGEYTKELVETDYGYHILMRYALPKRGEDYENGISSAKAEITSEKLEKQIDAWGEELGFIINQKYIDKLKIQAK